MPLRLMFSTHERNRLRYRPETDPEVASQQAIDSSVHLPCLFRKVASRPGEFASATAVSSSSLTLWNDNSGTAKAERREAPTRPGICPTGVSSAKCWRSRQGSRRTCREKMVTFVHCGAHSFSSSLQALEAIDLGWATQKRVRCSLHV